MPMRTHKQIIGEAGADRVREVVGQDVSVHTIRSWGSRSSIPAPYWHVMVGHELASLEELAAGAAKRLDREAA